MVFVETPSLTGTTLLVPTVVAILFVRSVSSLAESSDFDLTNTGPSVLLACTALYVTEDRSPNTCTYRQFQPPIRELFSILPAHPFTVFYPFFV